MTGKQVLGVGAAVLGIAVLGVASHEVADAACSADPPGVDLPAHDSRELRLSGIGGWDCLLLEGEHEAGGRSLGWWPR